jgi:acyl dehydratase
VYDAPQSYASSLVVAPTSNKAYAIASKDCNVIHLNPYIIPLASLPTTITHGMYSSARMRQAIAEASGVAGTLHGLARIVGYKAEFRGMVHPGTTLKCNVQLIAMQDGLKQCVGELRTMDTDTLVLKATARVQQSPIAYLFTGQGSAQVNMGQELYQQSATAKAVWDTAEKFLSDKYGFSILTIVRQNPKSLTVNFQQNAKGEEMKRRYLSLGLLQLKKEDEEPASPKSPSDVAAAATSAELARLPNSYTFQSSEGLLYATQFQQPSILLQETAAFVDLRSRGVVQSTAKLSGHSLGEVRHSTSSAPLNSPSVSTQPTHILFSIDAFLVCLLVSTVVWLLAWRAPPCPAWPRSCSCVA